MQILQKNLNNLRTILNDKVFIGEQILDGFWIKQEGSVKGNMDKFFVIDEDEQVPLMFAGFDIFETFYPESQVK